MKLVKSLVTLLFVIVLGVVVYFYVYKTEETRKAREIEERSLVRFDLDLIKKFTLARPDSSVVFERGIGRLWNITEPVRTEADGKPLFMLFNSLNQSNILVEVEKKLLKRVPAQYRQHAHHWLILHGRYVCKARKPDCAHCIVTEQCQYKAKTIA